MATTIPMRWLMRPTAIVAIALSAACNSTNGPYVRDGEQQPDSTEVSEQLRQRVMLVGDAGVPVACPSDQKCHPPVLKLMQKWASEAPKRTVTLFLGDNIYERGLPGAAEDDRTKAEDKLRAQYQVLANSGSKGIFVPGNHDWDGAFGPRHEAWARQRGFLKTLDKQGVLVYTGTDPGCPWPAYVDVDLEGVGIIVMDTQWWLTGDADLPASCRRSTPNEHAVAAMLEQLLEQARPGGDNPRDVIVASHHPLATHGKHGAWYRWFSQDLRGYRNRTMREEITGTYARSDNPPLIHAAGHDHSLQVLDGADTGGIGYNLVSGAGSPEKIASVSHADDTFFSHKHTGFMVIDFLHDGGVLLRVVEPMPDGGEQVAYTRHLRVAATL